MPRALLISAQLFSLCLSSRYKSWRPISSTLDAFSRCSAFGNAFLHYHTSSAHQQKISQGRMQRSACTLFGRHIRHLSNSALAKLRKEEETDEQPLPSAAASSIFAFANRSSSQQRFSLIPNEPDIAEALSRSWSPPEIQPSNRKPRSTNSISSDFLMLCCKRCIQQRHWWRLIACINHAHRHNVKLLDTISGQHRLTTQEAIDAIDSLLPDSSYMTQAMSSSSLHTLAILHFILYHLTLRQLTPVLLDKAIHLVHRVREHSMAFQTGIDVATLHSYVAFLTRWLLLQLLLQPLQSAEQFPVGRHWSWMIATYDPHRDAKALVVVAKSIVSLYSIDLIGRGAVALDEPSRSALLEASRFLRLWTLVERLLSAFSTPNSADPSNSVPWQARVERIEVHARQRHRQAVAHLWHQIETDRTKYLSSISKRLIFSVVEAWQRLGYHARIWNLWRWMCENDSIIFRGQGVRHLDAPLIKMVIASCVVAGMDEQACSIGDLLMGFSGPESCALLPALAQDRASQLERLRRDEQLRQSLSASFSSNARDRRRNVSRDLALNTGSFLTLSAHYNAFGLYAHTCTLFDLRHFDLPRPLVIGTLDVLLESYAALKLHARISQLLLQLWNYDCVLPTRRTVEILVASARDCPQPMQQKADTLLHIAQHQAQQLFDQQLLLIESSSNKHSTKT